MSQLSVGGPTIETSPGPRTAVTGALGGARAAGVAGRQTRQSSGQDPSLRMVAGSGETVGLTADGRRWAAADASEFITYRFGFAPSHLRTRRQLRALGLRPGGAQPVARMAWRHGQAARFAWLYDVTAARPKWPMTPRKAEALEKAMSARRTCPRCGREGTYCIPTSLGMCLDCHDGRDRSDGQAPA